jgi:hypothetical protein
MLVLREGDFGAFFEAPFQAYGSAWPYVSPMRGDLRRMLDRDANPLFRRFGDGVFFTAHRGRRVVGRITAHVHDASNRQHGLRRSCFGFFDCIDDFEVAHALLGAAERWGAGRGAAEIAGNFNLTAMQQLGVVTEGFDRRPFSDMQYNPPWIPAVLARAGYLPFFPMTTFQLGLAGFDTSCLLGPRQRELLQRDELSWTPITRRHLRRDLRDARELLNASFASNPMFVPVTEEEFEFQAADLTWIVDERLACVVREGSTAIGVLVCIPDLNPFLRSTRSRMGPLTPARFLRHRWRPRRAVILYWAVRPGQQNRGFTGAMLYRTLTAMQRAGYSEAGFTWIADVNGPSLRQVEKLGALRLHRLHLFRKDLA